MNRQAFGAEVIVEMDEEVDGSSKVVYVRAWCNSVRGIPVSCLLSSGFRGGGPPTRTHRSTLAHTDGEERSFADGKTLASRARPSFGCDGGSHQEELVGSPVVAGGGGCGGGGFDEFHRDPAVSPPRDRPGLARVGPLRDPDPPVPPQIGGQVAEGGGKPGTGLPFRGRRVRGPLAAPFAGRPRGAVRRFPRGGGGIPPPSRPGLRRCAALGGSPVVVGGRLVVGLVFLLLRFRRLGRLLRV